jgi:cytochrome c biogenesis protein CcmG/thiol:disulfide interchange protein DsbE
MAETNHEQPQADMSVESRKTRRPSRAKYLVLVVVVGLLSFWGFVLTLPKADLPSSPLVNKAAASFALEDLRTGKTVTLEQFRGKYLVLNFWASWCTSCKDEAAELEALYRKLGDRVSVVGIAIQDEKSAALEFNARYGQNFQTLLDEPGASAIEYGVIGIPETFVIDPQGQVRKKFIGEITAPQVEEALLAAGLQAG